MRHRKKFNHLGRKSAHRKETLSSLATALILNKRISTTVAKAKALRVYVEPLITKSKDDSTHSRRTVFSYLKNKFAVSELFREISQKVADRPGGYTRILKTGFRKGDAAEMCIIELVDYNVGLLKTTEDTQQKRTRRGRRGGQKAQDEVKTEVKAKEEKKPVEEVKDEVKPEEVKTEEKPVEETKDEVKPEEVKEDEKPVEEVKDEVKEEEKPEEPTPAKEEPKTEEPKAEEKPEEDKDKTRE